MGSALLKEAAYSLRDYYNHADELVQCVINHALGAAVSAAGAGCLPGVGSTIATGVWVAIIVKMYVDIGKKLGVKLGEGVLKSLASALVADLAGAVAASLAVSAALSFVPGLGTLGAAAISGATSFCYVYLAGVIYLKMLGALMNVGKSVNSMSEEELKAAMKAATGSVNVKDVVNEAKGAYKENKK